MNSISGASMTSMKCLTPSALKIYVPFVDKFDIFFDPSPPCVDVIHGGPLNETLLKVPWSPKSAGRHASTDTRAHAMIALNWTRQQLGGGDGGGDGRLQ